MDKLRAMATFVRIVDGGSLTAAADAAGTSLTSVVRSLAALEKSLGTRLLNRTTRRLSLTAEGGMNDGSALPWLDALRAAQRFLRFVQTVRDAENYFMQGL